MAASGGAGFTQGDLFAVAAHGLVVPTGSGGSAVNEASSLKLQQLRYDADVASAPQALTNPFYAAKLHAELRRLLVSAEEPDGPAGALAAAVRSHTGASSSFVVGNEAVSRSGENDAALAAISLLEEAAHVSGRAPDFLALAAALIAAGERGSDDVYSAPSIAVSDLLASGAIIERSAAADASAGSSAGTSIAPTARVTLPRILPLGAAAALRSIASKLRITPPEALVAELGRDTGTTVRRLLHHGLRLYPLAGSCSLDQLNREAKRAGGAFCTVGALGGPVRSGRWFFEVTILAKDILQVGWSCDKARYDPTAGYGVGDDAYSWGW